MRLELDVAGPSDDAEIRALLARTPVPGKVLVSYEREPSYFEGCRATDPSAQIIVARETATRRVVAVATRSVRQLYLNGRARDVGYLGQLRVDAAYRGRWLVSAGFRFLRELHEDGRVDRYLATITREGREARGLLVDRPRRHFPRFEPLADLSTIAIALGRRRRTPRSRYVVAEAAPEELAQAAAFVEAVGPSRQFFPVTTERDLSAGDVLLIARRGVEIAGVLRLWDQSAFKQAVVRGYAPSLGRLLPLYNVAMRIVGRPGVPHVGEPIRMAYACTVCAENGDAFAALLRSATNRSARAGFDYLAVGLVAGDPHLRLARAYPHVEYRSTLYDVHWSDAEREAIDGRLPYVEIATL